MRRSISGAELKAECTTLQRAVLSAGLATEAELAPWRPGAEKNSDTDARGWLRFYAQLHRKHARGENAASSDSHLRADAAVLAALRDEPIRVDLVTPVPMDDAGTMTGFLLVYQKSLDALLQAHALDRQIAWLLLHDERIQRAGIEGFAGASELSHKIMAGVAYAYGLLAWIMTSPGPEMPYRLALGGDPELPAYIRALNPIDFPQIAHAAQRHHARLAAVQSLTDVRSTPEGGKRPSWSQFMGTLAIELEGDAVQLTCFRSLGSLIASVQLNNDAKHIPDKPDVA